MSEAVDTSENTSEAPSSSPLFSPVKLGPIELKNRFIKCGTNEGLAREGLPTEALAEWHRRFARGGVAMTTLAYCSVAAEGRTFADQIWMREAARGPLSAFVDTIHEHGARAAIQLGHAGWFASAKAIGGRPLGPSTQFSPHAMSISRTMTDADLAATRVAFADAARLAVAAGFDALEIHMGHGYLLSQFLSPWNNRRKDAFGGSLPRRARFPREVLQAVREAAGDEVAVTVKLNMDDGFEGGLSLEESLQVAAWIQEDHSVDALQLTGGHTTRSPMFLMRGDVPLEQMIEYEPDFVRRMGLRLMGPWLVKGYPFEEAFFLGRASYFRKALALPIQLLGGLNRRDTMEAALAAGFEFMALGRALIRDPDLVERMRTGELDASRCDHCNQCVARMERPSGTSCVYWPEAMTEVDLSVLRA